jgi:hypothetical protein
MSTRSGSSPLLAVLAPLASRPSERGPRRAGLRADRERRTSRRSRQADRATPRSRGTSCSCATAPTAERTALPALIPGKALSVVGRHGPAVPRTSSTGRSPGFPPAPGPVVQGDLGECPVRGSDGGRLPLARCGSSTIPGSVEHGGERARPGVPLFGPRSISQRFCNIDGDWSSWASAPAAPPAALHAEGFQGLLLRLVARGLATYAGTTLPGNGGHGVSDELVGPSFLFARGPGARGRELPSGARAASLDRLSLSAVPAPAPKTPAPAPLPSDPPPCSALLEASGSDLLGGPAVAGGDPGPDQGRRPAP